MSDKYYQEVAEYDDNKQVNRRQRKREGEKRKYFHSD